MKTSLTITLPDWLQLALKNRGNLLTLEEKMRWVIALSRENIEQGTGGPFAAAIFRDDGECISVGVNLVTSSKNPVLHAETTAIMFAHVCVGDYFFNAKDGEHHYHLISSTEPCVMCLGASLWSGVTQLTCAARDGDARAIGFDEGPKPNNWQQALRDRGVAVQTDICRQEAVAVLTAYKEQQGIIYGH